MNQSSNDLDSLALAYLINKHGHPGQCALASLKERIPQHLNYDEDGLSESFSRAKVLFLDGPAQLYLCDGQTCSASNRSGDYGFPDFEVNCPVVRTVCQGFCSDRLASFVTLRIGSRCQTFQAWNNDPDRERILRFVRRALREDTLLVDPEDTLPLRFDPIHDDLVIVPQLEDFSFLIGTFRGHGSFGNTQPFFKEMIGSWQAGGAAIILRMAVAYPLQEGGVDVHEAFVLIAPHQDHNRLVGRAVTDGGRYIEYLYRIDLSSGSIAFDDQSPDHGDSDGKACKKLTPIKEGYVEVLEVEGIEAEYSRIVMHRVTDL